MSQLKNKFFAETGAEWENSQGEPDIDYVNWLEAKVEKIISTNKRMAKLLEEAAELLRDTDDGKIAEAWVMINGVAAPLRHAQ